MSFLGGWTFYDSEEKKVIGELTHDVDERTESFYRELKINFETLRSLAILFRNQPLPDIERFNLESGRILSRYPAIHVLAWVPRITHAERDSYRTARRQNTPAFVITENINGLMVKVGERSEYYPAYFVEPLMGNESTLGFDYASSEIVLGTLAAARDTDSPQAIIEVTSNQGGEKQKEVLVFLPIYREISTTVAMRRQNLLGFVLGVFNISTIFNNSTLIGEPAGIEMRVVDQSLPTGSEIVHLHKTRTGFEYVARISYKKELPELLGKKWTVFASPTAQYIAARRNLLPVSIFVLGITFTLFMVLYIFIISKRADIIKQTVVKKTTELNKANRMLEMISRTDALTGISNRRLMDEFIAIEWLRAIRNRSSIAFMLIDIDFFKLYNDNYGHPQGDEVLKTVAEMLNNLGHRPGDLVVRYGGDEFAIILTDTEDAEFVATKCCSSIRELQIPHEFSKNSKIVTLSVGLCTVFPEAGTDPNLVINAADQALYLAKEAGRNRVEQVKSQSWSARPDPSEVSSAKT